MYNIYKFARPLSHRIGRHIRTPTVDTAADPAAAQSHLDVGDPRPRLSAKRSAPYICDGGNTVA